MRTTGGTRFKPILSSLGDDPQDIVDVSFYCEIKMAKTTEHHNADKARKSRLQKNSESDSVLVSFNKALITSGKRRNERKIARDEIAASRQARRQGDVILKYSPN